MWATSCHPKTSDEKQMNSQRQGVSTPLQEMIWHCFSHSCQPAGTSIARSIMWKKNKINNREADFMGKIAANTLVFSKGLSYSNTSV